MNRKETREALVAAKTSIEDALMYLQQVRVDPVAMCNLQGHGSLDVVVLELAEQREYLMSAFGIKEDEHGYL